MASPKSNWLAFLSLLLLFQLSHVHSQTSYRHHHFKTNTTMMSTKCLESERQTLLQFKSGLSDPSHRLSSWTEGDCCSWMGVACSNDVPGHVIKLDLRNSQLIQQYHYHDINKALGGKLDPNLANLKQLRFLDLSCNAFNGIRIPEFMGSFKKLEYLNLSQAGFAGTIPHHLGNLSILKSLDLSSNYWEPHDLVIDNAGWLSGLTSLKYLNLSYVDISQPPNWLPALNMLPSLLEIHLSYCHLSSSLLNLPYVNFTSLSTLDLSDNYINSTLPKWLFNLSSLKTLDLSYNEGLSLSTSLGNLCKLQTLSLAGLDLSKETTKTPRIFSGCIVESLKELELANTNLQGDMPYWIAGLKNLKLLDLSNNQINSTLPHWLFNLTSISYLNLAYNDFHGSIPSIIGNMISLEMLYLHGNFYLEGPIPMTLGNLCKLQILVLSGVNISQNFQEYSGIFSGCIRNSLQELYLRNTSLSGHLPNTIWNIKYLRILRLAKNKISGSIPANIDELMSSLEILDLSYNQGTLSLPTSLGNLCKLQTLSLSGLDLSKEASKIQQIFSGCLGDSLQELSLSNTSLGGHLPDEIWNLKYLYSLNISHNSLSGSISARVGKLSSLKVLDLSNNQFSGVIPKSIGQLSNLLYLLLRNNNLEGMLTKDHFAAMTQLSLLSLSKNKINGTVPFSWSNNLPLRVLDFSSNNISGGIPNSICSVLELESLHLSNNSLSGVFPTSLRECYSLVTLDLSYNNFYGSIPHWIAESMYELQILNLKSNKFSSYLPPQLSSLPNLHILDLSHNNFFGSIPRNFGDFNAMTLPGRMGGPRDLDIVVFSTEYVSLVIKGNEYKCERILSLINVMDLSCNNLRGSIPEELTNLSGLKSLNLSENHLTGDITNKIYRMQELESLDLSRNNISGLIPLSLGSLDYLGVLNLSYNNLSGKIPFEKHLTTLDDPYIYIGNPELCGHPLSRNCSWDEVLTTSTVDGKQKDIWLHLGIGCGFVTGLWAVFIIMLFKKTWRVAYFRYVDNMWDDICVAILLKINRLKTKYRIKDHPMH